MATPRSVLVDDQIAYSYHLISRCVRRSYLCGFDEATGNDYTHRKDWLIKRIHHLAQLFALDVYAYAIMSNHFHLVVYYDPTAAAGWSDEVVADRWTQLCPRRRRNGEIDDLAQLVMYEAVLSNSDALDHARRTLGSLSKFMKFLKHPLACLANKEDGCGGHFFEGRFYSGVLLDEEHLVQAMAYVDLNPVRAKIARTIDEIDHASVTERLRARATTDQRIRDYLDGAIEPIASGLDVEESGVTETLERQKDNEPSVSRVTLFRPQITLRDYLSQVEAVIDVEISETVVIKERRWIENLKRFKHRQRAYGPLSALKEWVEYRGLSLREQPSV